MKKIHLIFGVLIALLVLTGCQKVNQEQTVSKIEFRTYGGFVMPEYGEYDLEISSQEAVLNVINIKDNSVTAFAKKDISAVQYDSFVKIINDANFMNLDDVYEDKEPMIADVGNADVIVTYSDGTSKKVTIIPFYDKAIPNSLAPLFDALLEFRSPLADEIRTAPLQVKFHPAQCENTPWEEWYEKGEINFVKEPTDSELITAYYSTVHNVQVTNVEKIEPSDIVVCEACGCSRGYHFTASVPGNRIYSLIDEGWTRI